MGIGISGVGRIGRLLIRNAFAAGSNMPIKAINSAYPVETIVHLLKYDSVHGTWDAEVSSDNGNLMINGQAIRMFYERDPARIPWGSAGIHTVIDATGQFNDRQGSQNHLQAGASTVIITAPGKQMDLTVVMGVNDHQYEPGKHVLLSAASCTTNCVAPVLHIIDQAFGVKEGWMTTIHSYTSDQRHMDNPHKDLRRARACTQSIVPTTTGIGKSLIDVLPHLASTIRGLSIRVPTPDVSLIDLTVQVDRAITEDKVKSVFKKASAGSMSSYVDYSEEPLVSSDYIGCNKSAVIDGLSLMVSGNQLKVLAWYDNEWAYACRVMDLARTVKERRGERERSIANAQ
ncbi:MAG: type I glyceraldehyde-3-phosphate dehydrogenase [Paenibacillaceae bacterium]